MSNQEVLKSTAAATEAASTTLAQVAGEVDNVNRALAKATNSHSNFAVSDAKTINDILVLATIIQESGFVGRLTKHQLATKMILGDQYGMSPIEALTGIHMIEGTPSLHATAIAARIKRSSKYRYFVQTQTSEACKIEFSEKVDGQWVPQGVCSFTIEEARAANLANKAVWKNHPGNMLFARAISNGCRFYCPDLFGTVVYSREEMTDGVVDVEAEAVSDQAVFATGATTAQRLEQKITSPTSAPVDAEVVEEKPVKKAAPVVIKSTEGPAEQETIEAVAEVATEVVAEVPVEAPIEAEVIADRHQFEGLPLSILDMADEKARELAWTRDALLDEAWRDGIRGKEALKAWIKNGAPSAAEGE